MKTVIYREQIVVNGNAYDLTTCDYSETVATWIADSVLPPNATDHAICDYIKDEVASGF